MSKPREVFVYYEDTIPASVYPSEYPKPYEEDGVLFREVMPQDALKDEALKEVRKILHASSASPEITEVDQVIGKWFQKYGELIPPFDDPEGTTK